MTNPFGRPLSLKREQAKQAVDTCPYCSEKGFLEVLDPKGRSSATPCQYWKNIVKVNRKRGCKVISTEKWYTPHSEERDVVKSYQEVRLLL